MGSKRGLRKGKKRKTYRTESGLSVSSNREKTMGGALTGSAGVPIRGNKSSQQIERKSEKQKIGKKGEQIRR